MANNYRGMTHMPTPKRLEGVKPNPAANLQGLVDSLKYLGQQAADRNMSQHRQADPLGPLTQILDLGSNLAKGVEADKAYAELMNKHPLKAASTLGTKFALSLPNFLTYGARGVKPAAKFFGENMAAKMASEGYRLANKLTPAALMYGADSMNMTEPESSPTRFLAKFSDMLRRVATGRIPGPRNPYTNKQVNKLEDFKSTMWPRDAHEAGIAMVRNGEEPRDVAKILNRLDELKPYLGDPSK
tara:strand:- start:748 stop:1476 length:729 start_codon:yes stop_codon:yes gene_type:complete